MTRQRVAAALLALAAGPLHAAAVPQGSVMDSRITSVPYDARDVVVIEATPGYVSRIVLAPGDSVCEECTRTGFPAGWEVIPQGDMIDVRPIEVQASDGTLREPEPAAWATNLLVRTREGRSYAFDLALAAAPSATAYHVAVTDPDAEAEREIAARRQALDLADARDARAALPTPRSFDYHAAANKHGAAIVPTNAWDDGRFTYLRFPAEIPAVFVIGADGTERTANVEPDPDRPDIMIVDRLASQLVLRLGRSVVSVFNHGNARPASTPVRPELRDFR